MDSGTISDTARYVHASLHSCPRSNTGDAAEGPGGRLRSSSRSNVATVKSVRRFRRLLTSATIILSLLAVPLLLTIGVGDNGEESAAPPHVLPIQTVPLEQVSSYDVARPYTGQIVAARTSELGFEFCGQIESISVVEGERVAVGTPLARLDARRLDTKRKELLARRRQAAARLAEMMDGPRAEVIAVAQAEVKSRQARLDFLTRDEARAQSLRRQSAVSQQDYERVSFEHAAAAAELDQANHRLDELLSGTREEQLQSQRAVVEQLDVAIVATEIEVEKSTLRAPFSGTIARRFAAEGTVVTAGTPVVRLVEDETLEAWIGVPPQSASHLAAASRQKLKVGETEVDAHVAGLLPEVDPATGTRIVMLRLDRPTPPDVVHGQIVQLEVNETVPVAGVWLPLASLARGSRGLWSCYVAAPVSPGDVPPHWRPDAGLLRRVERRDVEVLHTENDRVLVRGTIRAGERLVRTGTHRVVPGQFVREVE